MENKEPKIGAILVLYKPDMKVTVPAIMSLAPQVDEICLVDNTPGQDIAHEFKDIPNASYIPLGENKGIAAAQNIGIKHFINLNFDFVLFSDQDSLAPANIVHKLLNGYNLLKEQNIKIAAVGTRAINKQTGKPYSAKSKELGTPKELLGFNSADALTECYSVRASISVISTISLRAVGGFDETLFIDGVDHEWCWRAWHKYQLRSFIVEDAKINHMLGEGDRKIAHREIAIASSFRVYYQFRNFIWLSKRDYTPKYWKAINRKKYIVKALYFPIMVSPRLKYIQNIYRGIKDGLIIKGNASCPNFQEKKD